MNYAEQALVFDCAGERMLGIVAIPEAAQATGVLILVGGPQYRVGSHRQFLLLARRLATDGIAAMRFDFRGMGDSEGDERSFEAVGDDIAAALAAFCRACPELKQVVLWGLCDAAAAALLYWHDRQDARIAGVALLNPWVRSETGLAKTRVKHYYRQRLLHPEFWKKLLTGRLQLLRSLREAGANLRLAMQGMPSANIVERSFQGTMAAALQAFPGKILIILSAADYTAMEFRDWANNQPELSGWRSWPQLACHEIAAADHTFSRAVWREEAEEITLAWVQELAAAP